jgi:hypothetical protein
MICLANKCTAPKCGDGRQTPPEKCDDATRGMTDLAACNPECSGRYEKKIIKMTTGSFPANMGGPKGADANCQAEFGPGWKALIVGGSRRATQTPFKADGQMDWVIAKYTHYFNSQNQLLWRIDDVPLLGVRDGKRMEIHAEAFFESYPWGGYRSDWTTAPDTLPDSTDSSGTCAGWTTNAFATKGTFPFRTLLEAATEPCSTQMRLLCVEQ